MFQKIKWIPPLFVQIYLLFILSLGIGGIVTYLTNINNLRKNEEIILKQIVFFAQQSLLELMRQNFMHLENVSNEFGYTIVSEIPQNAMILLDNTDSFAEIKLFKFQQNYGFSLEYLGVEFVAFRDFSEELANGASLNIWLFLGFLALLLTFAMILMTISVVSCIAFFIVGDTIILGIISISSLVIALAIGILSPTHLTGYEYEATIDENVSMKEVYERYEIVEQRGDIWVLRDKKD